MFLVSILWFLIAGCSSGPLRDARKAFYSGEPDKASMLLSDVKNFPGRDRLLFLMEKGTILHSLRKYDESTSIFLQASRLIEEQETVSLSEQAASLITTEWITDYKGEYSERLWVHTYLMMNFLLSSKYENALVEAKQALKIFKQYPDSLSEDYFTRALIALCYENLYEINDAYIEYKKLAQILPDPMPVAEKLYQLGMMLGFADEVAPYKKFVSTEKPPTSEMIVFLTLGSGPEKVADDIIIPPSIRFSFPRYGDKKSEDVTIAVVDSGNRLSVPVISTDIDTVARNSLQQRAMRIIAKETTRAALKEAMARAVEHKNEEIVGILFRAALLIMEEADTRSWETLPAFLSMVRIPLTPGNHNIRLIIHSKTGRLIKEISLPQVNISAGRFYHSVRITY